MSEILRFGPHVVEVERPDKLLFPDCGFTRHDVVAYYRRIAGVMLPHLAGRPLTLRRYPDGIDTEGFVQKNVAAWFPDWIERATVPRKAGGEITQVVANNAATLCWLAAKGAFVLHAGLARADRPWHPDRLVFDLDPPPGADFARVCVAARRLRRLLEDLGMLPHVLATGSTGLHVIVRLDRTADFDESRAFADRVAALLVARHPDELTTAHRRAERGDRIYLDTLRNGYAQTSVAPFSLRARRGAPVAAPLSWSELEEAGLGPRRVTLSNVFDRLSDRPDPWGGLGRHAASIRHGLERLATIEG